MRYPMQNYEITVPLPPGTVTPAWIAGAVEAFHAAHERLYSYRDSAAPVQLINLRIAAIGLNPRPHATPGEESGPDPAAARKPDRPVHFQETGHFVTCPIFERERLLPGNRILGPAVVEQADATTMIPPGFVAVTDGYGRLVMSHLP
jgi:N-methylhydantoinase A